MRVRCGRVSGLHDMSVIVNRVAAALRGSLTVPGDKSIGHRAVIFGAVADGDTRVHALSGGADNSSTVRAFKQMGVRFRNEKGSLVIAGRGWTGLSAPDGLVQCGNSGTTMRLLAGLLAGRPFTATLDGDASLRTRPMGRVIEPLKQMGADIESQTGNGLAPLAIHGQTLHGIDYRSPVASAQVKSSILLAALQAQGATHFEEPYQSRNHTEIMARGFGAPIQSDGCRIAVMGGHTLRATDVTVPGDISSAAFFMVAAATLPGSDLLIRGVGCNPTRSGIVDVLRSMGAEIELRNTRQEAGEQVADVRIQGGELRGIEVGPHLVSRTIDEYPVLFVAAALAKGQTLFRDIGELRFKESDRIATMTKELSKLGVKLAERGDDLEISGDTQFEGAAVESHGDHRVAMAMAVAGLSARGGVRLSDAACVGVSFPGFFDELRRITES